MEGVIGSFIENFLIEIIFLLLTALVGYLGWWLRGKNIGVKMEVDIARMKGEERKHAKKGIILLMSLYRPFPENKGEIGRPLIKWRSMKEEGIKKALREKNYKAFDFENSSFGHSVRAILTHSERLEHCWIIGSYAKDSSSVISSSSNFIETFVEYLKKEKGINCQFHFDENYTIPMHDDESICRKARKLTNDIFTEAKRDYKLAPKDIIVDVTGGTLNMSLGLILASLPEDRDIQVIGTEYNSDGQPVGGDKSYPVRIHFKPEIISGLWKKS